MALFNMPMATLTDLDPPVIEGTTVGTSTEIYENIALDSFIARVQTDSPVASFTITSGNTGSVFQIAANGDITTANAPDYEVTPSFTLEIVATDHVGRESQPFTFTVNILDLDENAPVITLDTSATNLTQINEFVATDTLVATFDVVDNDTGGAVATTGTATLTRQYTGYLYINGVRTSTVLSLAPTADVTLSGNPSAQNFYTVWNYISTTNGQVEIWARQDVALAGGVDVDTDITLTVGVADEAGNYGFADYTITVNDWPDPSIFQPVQLRTPDNTFRIQENAPLGEGQGFLSQYTATGTVPVEFSVYGPDADKVTISSDGRLTLTSPLDYEAKTSHTFTVRATNYLYGSDGEIDQTYFDEEECTITVLNDTTDDPLVYDLGALTPYTPQHGIGVHRGDFFWTHAGSNAVGNYTIFPVWFDVSANSVSSGRPGSGNFVNTDWKNTNNSALNRARIYTTAGNGYLLTRHTTNYPTISRWDMSNSVGWTNSFHDNNSQSAANGAGAYTSDDGGLFIGSDFYARSGLTWYKWSRNSTPYRPASDINNISQLSHRTIDGRAFYALVGNYIYSLPLGEWQHTEDGMTSTSKDYIRILDRSTFETVGETSIEYWPGSDDNQENRGIAYDGRNIWICRGSELAKFTTPPSSNPTARLVPTK